MKNDIVSARLDIISAKAKILAEKYKNNQMWDGDLTRGLNEIESEISSIRRESGDHERGGWNDR